MVECPRCGLYLSDFKSECNICGYQPGCEDYYDYDIIDTNSIDKILKYNSIEVYGIVRGRKQISPNITNHICFCPKCNSTIISINIFIKCKNCGYHGYFEVNKEVLWEELLNMHRDAPFDFIEKYKLDNYWVALGNKYSWDYRKAFLCYDKAIELNELNGEAWFGKAIVYDRFGDDYNRDECYRNTIKCFNLQLKLNPTDDYTWNKKGEYFLKKKFLKRALNCFNNAIKYDSTNSEYWSNKGDCYISLKNYDLALKCYDEALSINKFLTEVWFSKALIFKKLENYSSMLECYDTIIEIEDSPITAWREKGEYYYMINDFKEAIICFEKSIEFDEFGFDLSDNLKSIGDCYHQMEEYSKALLYYDKSIKEDELNDSAWFQKALIYDKIEEYVLMLECYEKTLEIYPGNDGAWFNIGIYHQNNGRYMKAIKYFDRSLDIFSDDDEAWINKGDCYLMKNYYSAANYCYKEALKINPNNKYARDMVNELK